METQAKRMPGPCIWNRNEIVEAEAPHRAVAGLAPGTPDEWGHVFAAAPELLEAARHGLDFIRSFGGGRHYAEDPVRCAHCHLIARMEAVIARATGEEAPDV